MLVGVCVWALYGVSWRSKQPAHLHQWQGHSAAHFLSHDFIMPAQPPPASSLRLGPFLFTLSPPNAPNTCTHTGAASPLCYGEINWRPRPCPVFLCVSLHTVLYVAVMLSFYCIISPCFFFFLRKLIVCGREGGNFSSYNHVRVSHLEVLISVAQMVAPPPMTILFCAYVYLCVCLCVCVCVPPGLIFLQQVL